jgi:hypothetical protein
LCKLLLSYDADVGAKDLGYHPRPRIVDSNLSIFCYCVVFLNFPFDFLSDQHNSLFAILISCSISLGAPLHYAAKIGDVEMCKLLLSHKANVNARPAFGSGTGFVCHHFSTFADFMSCCFSESSFLI